MKKQMNEFVEDFLKENGYFDEENAKAFAEDGYELLYTNDYINLITKEIDTSDDGLKHFFAMRKDNFLQELGQKYNENSFIYTFVKNLSYTEAVQIAGRTRENYGYSSTELSFKMNDKEFILNNNAKITPLIKELREIVAFSFDDAFRMECEHIARKFEDEDYANTYNEIQNDKKETTMTNYEEELKKAHETIDKLRQDNKELRQFNDFYSMATDLRYGGYLEIQKALSLAKEYGLCENYEAGDYVGNLCLEIQNEEPEYDIDLVAFVTQEMANKIQNELAEKGIDIEFEIYPNSINTSAYLNQSDRETLEEALRENPTCLDDLSDASKIFLEEAEFNIEAFKEELLQEQENTQTQKIRRK